MVGHKGMTEGEGGGVKKLQFLEYIVVMGTYPFHMGNWWHMNVYFLHYRIVSDSLTIADVIFNISLNSRGSQLNR